MIKIFQDDFLHECFLQPCGHLGRGSRHGFSPLHGAGDHQVGREEVGGGEGEDHPDQHPLQRSPSPDTTAVCTGGQLVGLWAL